VVRAIWRGLPIPAETARAADIVAFLRAHPEICALNVDVEQTSWRDAEVLRASA
jgi:hypothetical protein